MKTRRFALGVLAIGLLAGVWFAKVAGAAEKPNIVFILTDDQAPWALGRSGHPHALTPHLDALFRQGVYLHNAFTTTPVCSPSRASLMTSRYGTELGITDWIHPRSEKELGLDPSTITWPEVLQQNGYTTGLVGKWHLGVPDKFRPTATGFDYFMGFREGGAATVDPVLEIDGLKKRFLGLTTDILTDHAMEFVRRNQSKPFLLCLHYRAPHTRWLPVSDADWTPFVDLKPSIPNPNFPKLDVRRVSRMTREYLASVHGVDRNVGRLMALLARLNLADDTIVIFTSDHGYNMGHNGIWHKGNGHWVLTTPPPATPNIPQGQRPNMYDNSLRVPTAVRWPGRFKAGARLSQTVTNLDWFPTILAMAGVANPVENEIHGRNFLPLLEGRPTEWDNDLYAQYSTHHQSHTHMRALRTPEWKLVRDFLNPERDELYDLKADPEEHRNLILSSSPRATEAIKELHKKILEHMTATNDPVLALLAEK